MNRAESLFSSAAAPLAENSAAASFPVSRGAAATSFQSAVGSAADAPAAIDEPASPEDPPAAAGNEFTRTRPGSREWKANPELTGHSWKERQERVHYFDDHLSAQSAATRTGLELCYLAQTVFDVFAALFLFAFSVLCGATVIGALIGLALFVL